MNMIDYTFLLIGLAYVTIVPGFVFVETFLSKLPVWKKIPLYLIFSVIISTFVSYFAGLIFGFNRAVLFGCFLIFVIPLVLVFIRRNMNPELEFKKNWLVILMGALVYAAYFTALYPAIFNLYHGYFVMGGPNWQDTAMHLSIIQSLTQGNFPPIAPYFSGQPLTYYYFSDLHAAIVNTLFGKFFPEVLVLINPFLAMAFFFSVFALSYSLTKNKIFSSVSGIMAVLFGNLGFVNLFKELYTSGTNYISLVTANPYNFDQAYMQMTPMGDYFLQNRPMMVGLSIFILVILLLIDFKNIKEKHLLKIMIAGVLTSALIKFQMFGFINSWIFFVVYFGLNFIEKKIKFAELLKYLLVFGLPSLLIMLIFSSSRVGSRSLVQVFLDTFSWGPWQKHDPTWFIYFFAENFGLGFIVWTIGIFTRKVWKDVKVLSIYLTSLLLLIIPLIMKFTIYEYDMLKFYYYLVPLICILVANFYSNSKHLKISVIFFILITIISSLTSVNMLVHSYLSKSEGYSYSDYEVGMWIIDNIPSNAVFVTMPTVHSAPTDIAGRLRIISYINWPYSHGFNVGSDNVFSRVKDVENVYKTGDISSVRLKYGARYVYYSQDERGSFPSAGQLFDRNKSLELIYNRDGIEIYEIN